MMLVKEGFNFTAQQRATGKTMRVWENAGERNRPVTSLGHQEGPRVF